MKKSYIKPRIVHLSLSARGKIKEAGVYLAKKYKDLNSKSFRLMLPLEASLLLPPDVYREVAAFRYQYGKNQFGALILRNFWPVDQDEIGPTPSKWQNSVRSSQVNELEFACALIHCIVGGNLLRYKCQRGGERFSDLVMPDISMKFTQTGAGYGLDLATHTEDAGVTTKADYLTLCWLRNFERVPSYLFSIRSIDWTKNKAMQECLRKKVFLFYPDSNYQLSSEIKELVRESPLSILYGNSTYPWFRTDNVEMMGKQGDNAIAELGLQWLENQIQSLLYKDFIPDAGDLVLINNRMVAHGRGKFEAGIDPDGNIVERRLLLRMMSHCSTMDTYEFANSDSQFLNEEILAGFKYSDLEKFLTRL